MFFSTASSRPDICLCPSLSIACIPYGCIENPIFFSLRHLIFSFFFFLFKGFDSERWEISPKSPEAISGFFFEWESVRFVLFIWTSEKECPRTFQCKGGGGEARNPTRILWTGPELQIRREAQNQDPTMIIINFGRLLSKFQTSKFWQKFRLFPRMSKAISNSLLRSSSFFSVDTRVRILLTPIKKKQSF